MFPIARLNEEEKYAHELLQCPRLDHIAWVVPNIDSKIEKLKATGFEIGKANFFDEEGTKEVYIGEEGRTRRLLLIQAVKEGPYLNWVNRRGFGLHHLGLSVENMQQFENKISALNWTEHPKSVANSFHGTRYWFKKGVCNLLEVSERPCEPITPLQPVINHIHIKQDFSFESQSHFLGIKNVFLGGKCEVQFPSGLILDTE